MVVRLLLPRAVPRCRINQQPSTRKIANIAGLCPPQARLKLKYPGFRPTSPGGNCGTLRDDRKVSHPVSIQVPRGTVPSLLTKYASPVFAAVQVPCLVELNLSA